MWKLYNIGMKQSKIIDTTETYQASIENYGPGVYFLSYNCNQKYLAVIFVYFILFCVLIIYLSLRDLILAINRRGIDNPLFALGASICYFVCRYC